MANVEDFTGPKLDVCPPKAVSALSRMETKWPALLSSSHFAHSEYSLDGVGMYCIVRKVRGRE